MLPAIVTWINPASGNWDTAANWSDGTTNRLPGPNDDAIIDTAGITVTHSSASANDAVGSLTSAATLAISGGTLAFGAPSTVSSLTLSGGALTGPGDVTIDNSLLWTGGTMSGAGHTIVSGTAEVGGSSGPLLNGRALDNAGTAVVDNGATLNMFGGAVFTNEAGATLTLQGTGSLGGSASEAINNAGQFIKAGPTNSAANLGLSVDNTGTMDVAGGSLTLFSALTNEGTLHLEQGTSASLAGGTSSGDFSLDGGSSLAVNFSSFTLQTGATVEVAAGAQFVINGTVTQEGGAAVTLASGGVVRIGNLFGATYALNNGATVSGPGVVQVKISSTS
jgi:hypothetical protein